MIMHNQKNYTQYVEWGVMAILFFIMMKLTVEFEFVKNLKPDTTEEDIITIIGSIIIVHIVIVMHELGHLIAGLIQGFKFELFVVGLLGIKREGQKIKPYLNKNLGYYGGVAGTSPVDDSPENAKKFARILLAGPIASILFGIVCLVISLYIIKPLGIIFYTGGITSIGIFFATTIPSKTGMFFSDRKRYQRLVTPGKDQEVELAMLNIMGKFLKDHSYKDINREDIEILVSDDMEFIKYFGLFNMICWQLEQKGEVEKEIKTKYESVSKQLPKNLVKAFNKEIENYSEKIKKKSIIKY
jgi:hypothetical protein